MARNLGDRWTVLLRLRVGLCHRHSVRDESLARRPIAGGAGGSPHFADMLLPDFDHIAFAVADVEARRTPIERRLGAAPAGGGTGAGFRFAQWRMANGMRIELLEPHDPDAHPFLARFLEFSGPGAHHLTFRVADVRQAVAAVEDAGFEVLSVRTTDPAWQEAFLHPRVAFGTVVQLAAYAGKEIDGSSDPAAPQVTLDAVELAVDDRPRAVRLFSEVLGGTVTGDDIRWPGRASLRLVDDTPPGIRRIRLGGTATTGGHIRLFEELTGAVALV